MCPPFLSFRLSPLENKFRASSPTVDEITNLRAKNSTDRSSSLRLFGTTSLDLSLYRDSLRYNDGSFTFLSRTVAQFRALIRAEQLRLSLSRRLVDGQRQRRSACLSWNNRLAASSRDTSKKKEKEKEKEREGKKKKSIPTFEC